jgi:phenylpropionate dioxygenase-like ring-hydroxylating dioxygenase large terminal subunit
MQALRNAWYCAAFGKELEQKPLARTILGEPVVLYRTSDGRPVAFEDRCCHRRVPLSAGKIEGCNLRCGYHGLLYEPSGKVIWAPGQDHLPLGAQVRAYPIVEKHGWVWLWPGEPALAAQTPPPNYDKYDDPNWASYEELLPINGNYFLVVDNLLDLSHLPFLHAATIGSPEDVSPNLKWERGPDRIKGTRVARGLSPSQRNLLEGLDFRFDRTQIMHFQPPSQVTIDILSNEFGKEYGAPDDRLNRRIIIYDAIAPETDTSCHYFWAISRDFAIHDRAQTELGLKATQTAFREDKGIIEKQQTLINRDPDASMIDLIGDSGGLQARRIIERLLAAEQHSAKAAE